MAIKTKQYRYRHYKYYDRTGYGLAWNNNNELLWSVFIKGKKYPKEKNYGYLAKSKQEAIYMAFKELDNLLGHIYFGAL